MMDADLIKPLQERFKYRIDNGTGWQIMDNDTGPLRGDCEDFALTALWMLAGKSMARFWWLQASGRACLWYTRDPNGVGHCMLWVKGLGWIDNWYPSFGKRRHPKVFPYLVPMVAAKLMLT